MEDDELSDTMLSAESVNKPKFVLTGNTKLDRFNLLSDSARLLLEEMLSEDP